MFSQAFPNVAASPSLVWIVAAICLHIFNAMIGIFMAFRKKNPSIIRIHGIFYYAIVFCLGYFLIMNGIHSENTIWDYLVGIYFITIVPLSKRWDVLLHAFISLMGLTFLPLLILLQV